MRISELAGGLAKSAEQKFSEIHLEQADKYCPCHYSLMYCVPCWRSSYGKETNILMSRFQIGCLELRCSKYRQMSGGFLFGLQEMQVSERSLSTMSLLKASMNVWNEYITPDADDESMWNEFEHDLKLSESDIDSCMLDEERVKVITVIAGYIATQTNKTTNCDLCQELSTRNTGNLSSNDCLNKLPRRGLTTCFKTWICFKL